MRAHVECYNGSRHEVLTQWTDELRADALQGRSNVRRHDPSVDLAFDGAAQTIGERQRIILFSGSTQGCNGVVIIASTLTATVARGKRC
jgi:chemotaxis response regulator CheB